MRKFALLMASAALIAFQASGANATTFDWSYSDGGSNVGSGTLDATYVSGDEYAVTSIAGTANLSTIVGLSSYDGPDQLVYSPSPPDVALDTLGISFSVAGGLSYNIYEDDTLFTPGPPYGCGGVYCLLGPGTVGAGDPDVAVDFSLTPVATPLPSTWTMLIAAFAGFGFLAYRGTKKDSAALAAA